MKTTMIAPILRQACAVVFFAAILTRQTSAQVVVGPGHPYTPPGFTEGTVITDNYVSGGAENSYQVQVQPFQTPDSSNVALQNFVLYYNPYSHNQTDTSLEAEVVEWDWNPTNGTAVGPVLWTSTLANTTVLAGAYQTASNTPLWASYTFDTSGLVLDPSKTYAFLASQTPTSYSGDTWYGLVGVVYANGYLPTWDFVASGSDFNQNVEAGPNNWGESSGAPLAYTATFAVPEPLSAVLLLGGGALLALRRKRSEANHTGR
jgi:hypothetical protein